MDRNTGQQILGKINTLQGDVRLTAVERFAAMSP